MPKLTLLKMVQNVLSSTNGDEVDAITDTLESSQIADLIEETYYDMITNKQIPEHSDLFQLTALADTDTPSHLQIPTDVDIIHQFQYNVVADGETRVRYQDIVWEQPEDFLTRVNGRNSTESIVDQVSADVGDPTSSTTIQLNIRNDKRPEFWTTFDDKYLICDSYDSAVDSTLQASKTLCRGVKEPTWTKADAFVPDMDFDYFPALMAEVKSTYWVNEKQTANPKEEQKSRRQQVRLQKNKHMIDRKPQQPDYGRK